ncbi:HNH endonuclease signature motif containing protein [Microbacterium aurantiacum]|uniref:HNH endonuclease signature motif containing protein n=1 Tax=Microbacterium aurantiacum TaxID=162393 RepID=UPI0006AD248D|nr:HNH endonuclease signature motif containing protein [Microbacterium chocolatum]ANG84470.1 hypothetical protein A8L33_02900 [Microbacterium chocolatum]
MNTSSAHAEHSSSRAELHLIDEADVLDALYADQTSDADRDAWEGFIRAQHVEARYDASLDQLDDLASVSRRATATQWRVIDETLGLARQDPEPWVGVDPTADPAWSDPRGRSVATVRRLRSEFAVRAAVADIGTRLRIAEVTVHAIAERAATLRARCPRVWADFLHGRVSPENAAIAADVAAALPDDPAAWALFDDAVADAAQRCTPSGFRRRARAARERVHPEPMDERHARAREDRSVCSTPEFDGLATISLTTDAADAASALDRVDGIVDHLQAQDGETRTRAQLRADVAIDLLRNGSSPLTAEAPSDTAISITIPMMTLLGRGDAPATLDGYGPIPLETARRYAAGAKSLVRILTDPVTGTVLDIDRRTRRIPADLRRWLWARDPECAFPGCARSSRECDIDHRLDWQYGGNTSAENNEPLCTSHHPVKHESLWSLSRDPVTGALQWTSPSGMTVGLDPPPF